MILLIFALVNFLIIGLFFYSKLTPHKARLTGRYLKLYNFFENLFEPILNLLRLVAKPIQVGTGIAVDMSQIVLLLLLLLILASLL